MDKHTGINTGKICKIEIIEKSNIESMITELDQHRCVINLHYGKSWETLPITDESAELTITDQGDDDGSKPAKEMKLMAEVPKVTAERIATIHARQAKPLICRATNTEGTLFIIGTTQSPAILSYGYLIGKKAQEPNTMQITLSAYSSTGLLEEAAG